MAGFLYPVDIGNRALQHVGARRIATFADISKNASELGFLYDKIRKAELMRSVWRFAVRESALRAVTSTTTIFVPPTWLIGTTYGSGAIVSDPSGNGVLWQSFLNGNVGNTPGLSNANVWFIYYGPITMNPWSSTPSYYAGELVSYSGSVYRSLLNGNIGFIPGGANSAWLLVGTTNNALFTPDPIGFDPNPADDVAQRSYYRLPSGFLRFASQDQKNAGVAVLNISGGMPYTDFAFEGNNLITTNPGPIIFRYVADYTDVSSMYSMFCEGVAARCGMELCETLTQSPQRRQMLTAVYNQWIKEARAVNAIEAGGDEIDEMIYNDTGEARLPTAAGDYNSGARQQQPQGR
jgi:hypothetical protein